MNIFDMILLCNFTIFLVQLYPVFNYYYYYYYYYYWTIFTVLLTIILSSCTRVNKHVLRALSVYFIFFLLPKYVPGAAPNSDALHGNRKRLAGMRWISTSRLHYRLG
jgi:hypothetical protein